MIEIIFNTSLAVFFACLLRAFGRLITELVNGQRQYKITYSHIFTLGAFTLNVCIWIRILA